MHHRPLRLEAIITAPSCRSGSHADFPPLCCWQSNDRLYQKEVNISDILHTGVCQRCDSCGSGRSQPLINVAILEIHVIELQPLYQLKEQLVSRGFPLWNCKSFSLYESRHIVLLVHFIYWHFVIYYFSFMRVVDFFTLVLLLNFYIFSL